MNKQPDSAIRILIVDDDIGQADMLREFLRISGFSAIEHVENIRDLWRRLKDHTYDIILLDYILPDGTGLDVLRQMPERDCQIPVVMVTGQGSERIAAQAIQNGATDYLIKTGDYLMTIPALIDKTLQAQRLKLSMQRSLEQIRYQALLLNNVRDAIVVWDIAGQINYWNPAASNLFGWNSEERLGMMVDEVYLPIFTPPIQLPDQTEATQAVEPADLHVMRKAITLAGKTIWVSSHVTALYGPGADHRLIGYMDVSHDITRSVEAEQALRESEARYRAIVEDYQTELICRFRPNGIITFANEVYCLYFERSRDELIGMNFLYFIPETDRLRIIQHLASFGSDRHVATLEHQVVLRHSSPAASQEIRWLQRTDRAIFDPQGHIFEFQSMGRDINDRKKMEAQLQAAQAHLVRAARLTTIGEMASGFAHQIYNPLTTIIADTQLLLRDLPPASPTGDAQPVRESAEAIQQAGWRLQQVVQRLMEFSRPPSEVKTSVSVNSTIQNALSLVNSHIEEIGCRIETKLSEGLPELRGNSSQLENLWVYLLLLARDACLDGQGNLIRAHSYTGPANTVFVEIHDNGTPIPADQLATIFEPNFVGPTNGRGTGMELSICREIVRQHNGQITADSRATDGKTPPTAQTPALDSSAPPIFTADRDTIFRVAFPAAEDTDIQDIFSEV
jgi:two-component system cell cycle sensor histidine kinase/response regulator CckA